MKTSQHDKYHFNSCPDTWGININWSIRTSRRIVPRPVTIFTYMFTVLLFSLFPYHPVKSDDWQSTGAVHSWWQSYFNSSERENSFNVGIDLNTDYLDSGGLQIGYNYTFVSLKNDAEISENMLHAGGFHHSFLDVMPGKLTFRLDAHLGKETLSYDITNPPANSRGRGRNMTTGTGSSSTIEEETDIYVLQPQLAFINYSKTLHADLGYSWSKYDGEINTVIHQITPTLGIGWNESYDWLQLRAYLSRLDETSPFYADDQHQSLEVKYSHWFDDKTTSQIELIRFSLLAGERILAVDPDTQTVYSNADMQTGSLTASIQWKTSDFSKVMALLSYGQYKNHIISDKYNSLLVYFNIQHQW